MINIKQREKELYFFIYLKKKQLSASNHCVSAKAGSLGFLLFLFYVLTSMNSSFDFTIFNCYE
jgi:hypothetical protein